MKRKMIPIIVIVLVLLITFIVLICLESYGLLGLLHPIKKAKDGQIKVACVGDSLTYGFGVKDHFISTYPQVLQNLLGDDYCVNNFGYSGRAVSLESDKPYMNEKLYKKSLEFNPDIVIIMLGSNDCKSYNWNESLFRRDYKALVESYMSLSSHPHVFLLAPPPVFEMDSKKAYNIDANMIKNNINPIVKEMGLYYGLDVIDMYEEFKDKSNLYYEGTHLNKDGASLFANIVYQYIK